MPFAIAADGVKLYFEEAGSGTPIVFVHEFGGDHRSWEPQMRHFARRHRCITYAARGYPPSDVPSEVAAYSQRTAATDILAVMDGAGVDRAHVVGLSMGGFAVLHLGLIAPARALSLTVAGAGYGAEKQHEAYFRDVSLEVARQFEAQGCHQFAKTYALGASRVQFQNKDPRGWAEFAQQLGEHDAAGSANTMRGVQATRPSLYDLEACLAASNRLGPRAGPDAGYRCRGQPLFALAGARPAGRTRAHGLPPGQPAHRRPLRRCLRCVGRP